jgi:molybdopterin molybdotransferase
MLEVAQAQSIVLQHARPLPPETVRLTPAALGLVLAEDIVCDLDSPPYDKAVMDGYAVRAADLAAGPAELTVVDEITAGRTPRVALGPGQAARIMTGAPIPVGADAVVMVEKTRLLDGQRVRVEEAPVKPGRNILRQGQEMCRGAVVLPAGTVLRPPEFGLLATVGRTAVQAHPRPRLAHITTGDELVEADTQPGPGQIRNGNSPMLLAQAAAAGASPHYLGIARDNVDDLRAKIEAGLRFPILVLSGGVSAGKLDLVPGVLQDLGVTAHFHKVHMKPGKPVLFGTGAREGDNSFSSLTPLVFGLPGNPVSSLVCCELFVRPAIRRLAGHADADPPPLQAALAEDFAYPTDRPTYHPAWLDAGATGWRVRPVPWFGSADLRGLTRANALMLLPAGDLPHPAGQPFSVWKIGATA